MIESPLLSILIPSIPSRIAMLDALLRRLSEQIGSEPVEIISLLDNKAITIGEKRDKLVQLSRAKFLAICDDDDFVHPGYIEEILKSIRSFPETDVVVFSQHATINGNKFTVRFGLEYENQQAQLGEDGLYSDITRKPFPCCVWRSELAKSEHFPSTNYGEDWAWAEKLCAKARSQARIEKVLHTYRFDDKISEADNGAPQ